MNNSPTERQIHHDHLTHSEAIKIARSYEPGVAWPTVLMVIVTFVCFWLTAWLAASGKLSLWFAIPINTFLAYASYTPAHEAVHGNVADKNHRLAWLNNTVGVLAASPLLHNFHLHQLTHLAHHSNTNDPEKDPDHWMAASHPFSITWRALTMVFAHYVWEVKLALNRNDRVKRISLSVIQNLTWFAAIAWLALQYDVSNALCATLLSAWLGSGLLALAFDWLPHHPHTSRERWLHTRVVLFPPIIQKILDQLLFQQTYHLVHHLYPRVPFYRYPDVFYRLRHYFSASGAKIY
jgi:beta-carotene hydroxylase